MTEVVFLAKPAMHARCSGVSLANSDELLLFSLDLPPWLGAAITTAATRAKIAITKDVFILTV